MKKFFSSIKFKILIYLLILMAGFMAYAGANGRLTAFPQELLATALVPLQRLGSIISGGISDLQQRYTQIDKVLAENEQLKQEMDALRETIVDYDDMKAENDLYRSYYQVADTYSDYQLVSAFVIGRDPLEKYYSFTIDRGTRDGIAVDDVVIAPEGVVGKVSAVGYNYAEVLTVLDPQVSMGCIVSRTRDIGLAEGDSALSQEGRLKMSYLPRETLVAAGDLVVTTGLGGVFPAGLIVGSIEDARPESSGKSMYAVVAPTVDVSNITSVFVIINYDSSTGKVTQSDTPADSTPASDTADSTDGTDNEAADTQPADAQGTDGAASNAEATSSSSSDTDTGASSSSGTGTSSSAQTGSLPVAGGGD